MTGGETGSRLIYGIVDGQRMGRWRATLAVAAAQRLDRLVALSGLAAPVLLVSGFWRSGTTWVQELMAEALGAKTVFEPLSPQEAAWRAILAAAMPADDEDRLQACIPGPRADAAFWSYLDRAARGRHASPFLMSCRRTAAESLRRGVVVKDVRLQCNLAPFHHRFGVPVVHVRRHPCAVVASLIAADWHWSFDRVQLADLVRPFGIEATSVRAFDTDAPSRIATCWALTEHAAEAAIAGQSWGVLLHYEALVDDAEGAIAATCTQLGLRPVRGVDARRPSASVHPAAFAAYGVAPQERWRSLLTPAVADRVCCIADALHPAWRDRAG